MLALFLASLSHAAPPKTVGPTQPSCIVGSRCNDGNPCTTGDVCVVGGACRGTPVANGTPCDDGSVCTQPDSCQSGVCTGTSIVTCASIDPCHDAGACNPVSGICSSPTRPCAYPPNFQLLNSDNSWGSLWTQIIPGRFTSSPYTSLLFFNQATGYAELYETNGNGAIVRPAIRTYAPLGNRTTWTHVIPGYFGSSGKLGLLLYDQPAGFARFFENQGNGNFVQLSEYSGWRNTWTQIVPGMFTMSSTTSLFFYSPSEHYAEIWNTNATGLAGASPFQTIGGLRDTWSKIVAADFYWTPDYIASGPVFSDLVFYEGATGWTEMYRVDPTGLVPNPIATGKLAPGATNVVAGQFGGSGNSGILLHNRSTGEMQIYAIEDQCDGQPAAPCSGTFTADFKRRESMTGLGTSVDLVVPGQFYRADTEEHWFDDGPSTPVAPDTVRNWRAATGGFTDLLLYDRGAGLGRTYYREQFIGDSFHAA